MFGCVYFIGKSVVQDMVKTENYFQQAAMQEPTEAQHFLELIHKNNSEVKIDVFLKIL